MNWIGRVFIVIGALLVFLAASIGMHEVEQPGISDAAIIVLTAAICLGLLLLSVGCALEHDALEYEQAEASEDA